MNERIRELAEQAEKYALDNVGKGYYGIEDLIYQFQFVDTKMEKFAELIVRECISITDELVVNSTRISNELYADHNGALFEVKRRIESHFGVEE